MGSEELVVSLEAMMADCSETIPAELMAELEKEIARNQEANRLAKIKEQEAKAAKERADRSQAEMASMNERYNNIRLKVESARSQLCETQRRMERQNALAEHMTNIRQMLTLLMEKVTNLNSSSNNSEENKERNEDAKKDYVQTIRELQQKLVEEETATKNVLDEQEVERKEREAQVMREKVEEMQRLLSARKQKLRDTESAIEARSQQTQKVEKQLAAKERRVNYIERKKIETIMFAQVPKQ